MKALLHTLPGALQPFSHSFKNKKSSQCGKSLVLKELGLWNQSVWVQIPPQLIMGYTTLENYLISLCLQLPYLQNEDNNSSYLIGLV